MKQIKNKQNKIIRIFNVFLVMIFIFMLIGYYYFDFGKYHLITSNDTYNLMKRQQEHSFCIECNKNINLSDEEKEKCVMKGFDTEPCLSKQSKLAILPLKSYATSAQEFYEKIITSEIASYVIPFFIPLLVIFPTILLLSKEFSNKNIKNNILRQTYKDYIKSLLKKSYSNIWIIPTLFVILYLISLLITGNFDYRFMEGYTFANHYGMLNKPMFYILYVSILYLNFAFYINIAIIVVVKNKNFIIALLESYIVIYFIWIFNEIVLSRFLQIINIDSIYSNFLNIYTWESISNMWLFWFFNFIYWLISSLTLLATFKNKEKIFMIIER